MNRSKIVLAAWIAVFLAAGVIGMANTRPVAEVMIGSSGISWQPTVEHSSIVLNVSGPEGIVISKTFKAGSTPYVGLVDNTGKHLIDGAYTYELRVIPRIEKKIRPAQEGPSTAMKDEPDELRKPLTQTGYFQVKNGSIVTASGPEEVPDRPLDIVHADDVIIDGSLCVGNDCYSGLAFGFDTIVLMENNLRIFFDDTSSIQNYPRNDWRIICNDSTDGGGNYFAVEDATDVSNILVLEAGAPDNSLYVDSHGDVGINTSTPYYELHIVDGDSPCVRLDQDGSYGWTPQKWDLCGNESNFFIRDATHASKLPFRIEPEAPTNSIFVKSDGSVGLGTGSPSNRLEIETTGANSTLKFDRTDGATVQFAAKGTKAALNVETNHQLEFGTNNTTRMTIAAGGNVGIGTTSPSHPLHMGGGAYCTGSAWMPSSSREYKENIVSLAADEAEEALEALNPVKFNYKNEKDEDYIGFIAEDVPELVATKNRKSLNPLDVVAVLTRVVQEQQKMNQEQQETISELQKKIVDLEKRLNTKK